MKASDIKRKVIQRNPGVVLAVKKDLAYQVARHIEDARLTMGITQQKLAERVGTQQSNIARAESGNFLPSLSFLKRIAEVGFNSYLIPPRFAFMEGNRSDVKTMSHQASDITANVQVAFHTTLIRYNHSHVPFPQQHQPRSSAETKITELVS